MTKKSKRVVPKRRIEVLLAKLGNHKLNNKLIIISMRRLILNEQKLILNER